MQNAKSVEKIIGKCIQKIRRAKGNTQQQFDEMVGLTTNYLPDNERGNNSAQLDKSVAIINALECSANGVFFEVIDFGYKVKRSRLSECREAFLPEEQEKAFAILDDFVKHAIKYQISIFEPVIFAGSYFWPKHLLFSIVLKYTNAIIVSCTAISLFVVWECETENLWFYRT